MSVCVGVSPCSALLCSALTHPPTNPCGAGRGVLRRRPGRRAVQHAGAAGLHHGLHPQGGRPRPRRARHVPAAEDRAGQGPGWVGRAGGRAGGVGWVGWVGVRGAGWWLWRAARAGVQLLYDIVARRSSPPPPQASPPPLSSPPRLTTSSPSPATPSSPPSPSRGRVTSPGKSPRARCRRERGRLAVSVAWDQGIGGWRPQPSTLDSTSSLPLSPNSRRWCLASSAACWAASSWAAPASSARGPSAWWASTAAPCCSCSSSSTTTCCRVRAALSALRCTGLRCTGLPGAGTGERRCGVPCWRSPLPPPWPHHRCRAHTVACRWCTGRAVRGAGGVQRMGARRAPLRLPWAFARLLARE